MAIIFSAYEIGNHSDTLWIYSDADTQYVLLEGNVRRKPTISISDTVVDFGTVPCDSTVQVELTVTNVGGFDLIVNRIISDNEVFSPSVDYLPPIPAGESASFTVYATVGNAGEYNGTLSLYSEYDTAIVLLHIEIEETKVVEAENVRPERALISAYPNPFNSYISINITGATDESSFIEVFDIGGNRVFQSAGNSVVWNAGNARNGMYVVRAIVGNNIIEKRIICVK